jgi:hypothetical protein
LEEKRGRSFKNKSQKLAPKYRETMKVPMKFVEMVWEPARCRIGATVLLVVVVHVVVFLIYRRIAGGPREKEKRRVTILEKEQEMEKEGGDLAKGLLTEAEELIVEADGLYEEIMDIKRKIAGAPREKHLSAIEQEEKKKARRQKEKLEKMKRKVAQLSAETGGEDEKDEKVKKAIRKLNSIVDALEESKGYMNGEVKILLEEKKECGKDVVSAVESARRNCANVEDTLEDMKKAEGTTAQFPETDRYRRVLEGLFKELVFLRDAMNKKYVTLKSKAGKAESLEDAFEVVLLEEEIKKAGKQIRELAKEFFDKHKRLLEFREPD